MGDSAERLKLVVYADASFAGDTRDSKSTSGGLLCLVGPRTFVPLNWICKKQSAVSHSSTEAEIIAFEALMRMEGLPMLNFWSQVLNTFNPPTSNGDGARAPFQEAITRYDTISFDSIDYVSASLPMHQPNCRLVMVEDSHAVIQMLQTGRAPSMAHVARTHRVNLDWLLERLHIDESIYCR